MRILIFSDTHLTDKFDEKKYIFLKKIISSVDQVIINGDFWDGYLTSFDKFIDSKWKILFPLLLKKKAVYIYGNHDEEKFSDKRVRLFSVTQKKLYRIVNNHTMFIIEHGDRILPTFDQTMENLFKKISFIVMPMIHIGYRLFLTLFGYAFIDHYFSRYNRMLKKKLGKKVSSVIRIFGHTHYPEIDLSSNFANTGANMYSYGQYLLIKNGKLELKLERYD